MRPRLEPQRVGDDERRHAEQRVGDDVERDEQAVVAPYHRVSCGRACSVSSTAAVISVRNRSRPNARRGRGCAARSKRSSRRGSSAGGERLRRGVVDQHPGLPSHDVSRAPPRPRATTGRPHAWASTGTMPKSSSPGSSTAAAPRYSVPHVFVGEAARETATSAPALRRRAWPVPARRPTIFKRHAGAAGPRRWPDRSACRARAPTPPGA